MLSSQGLRRRGVVFVAEEEGEDEGDRFVVYAILRATATTNVARVVSQTDNGRPW